MMLQRWTAILLAMAALVGPLVAVSAAATTASTTASTTPSTTTRCCSAKCCCSDRCPCAANGNHSTPAPEQPAVPAPTRDLRVTLLLPATPTVLALETIPCGRVRARARSDGPATTPSGRRLLELVSRWTT